MGLIQFERVTKRYDHTAVLDDITLTIDAGEVVVIVGPSGSGKSTLLRCINALETIEAGELRVNGLSVSGPRAAKREIRREAGMVFQHFNLFPQLTALKNVMFGLVHARAVPRRLAQDAAAALLEKVGLADRMHHYPAELSGGQQQRVAIARALAVKPQLMLFDEPTSALDPELRQEVLEVMRTLADEGMTMVVVTHEMAFAQNVGSRLLFMTEGRIMHDGAPQELLNRPPSQRLADFLRHVSL